MWEAKSLIQAGARWMVGSGEKIDIIGQPWLNETQNPYVTSTSEAFKNNKVSSLLTMDRSNWDTKILSDLFNVRDQDCIKRVPYHGSSSEDSLYWSKEASGMYTVKSAYRLLHLRRDSGTRLITLVFGRKCGG